MTWPLTGRDHEQQVLRDALADPGRRGLLFVGPPGVGTTRLLEVAADHATARGWSVLVVRASPTLQQVPFGVIRDALTQHDAGDVPVPADTDHHHHYERSLRPQVAGGRVLIAVDDAQWLDRSSIELIERIAGHDWVRMVLALHEAPGLTGEVPTPAMRLVEIEVLPLDRRFHDALVESAFVGPLTSRVRQRLWELTGGRPRDLQLVAESLSATWSTPRRDALQQWDGAHLDSPGLRALAATSLRGLPATAREAFDIVAYASSLPLVVAHEVIDDLELLERTGLLDEGVHDESGTPIVRVARPIVGATVASRLSPATRRRIAATLAACDPPPGAWWRWCHAAWADEAGFDREQVDVGIARRSLDRVDLAVAERMCRSAIAGDPGDFDGHLSLAECLRRRGRATEAMNELEVAAGLAGNDDERVSVAVRRAQVSTLLGADPVAGLDWLDQALDEITRPAARARLEHEREFTEAFLGAIPTVRQRARPTLDGSDDTVLGDLLLTAFLQALHLDLVGIDDALERCRRRNDGGDALEPMVDARLAVVHHLAEIGRGRIGPAHDEGRVKLADAARRGEALGLWAVNVVFSGPLVGDLDGAVAAAIDADESFRRFDPFGLRSFAAGLGVTASLQAGRVELADALFDRARSATHGADPRVHAMGELRSDAWRAMLEGDVERAATMARDAALAAIAAGHRLWGVIALHDPVRWGAAPVVADDLATFAAEVETPLTLALHRHADAAATRGAVELDLASERFAAMGCWALAAEAAAQAAQQHADVHAATRAATRADLWRTSCSGDGAHDGSNGGGLTGRQREVARLAALGLSTRDIADELVLSSRTVDNHLRLAYRRLGVSGRSELRDAFDGALIP